MLASPTERRERYRRSPAWNGRRFANLLPAPMFDGDRADIATRFLFDREGRFPPAPLPSQPVDARVLGGPVHDGLRATWLGHSTVLVEIGGFRVLTDPVWSERASPLSFAGPRRFQPVPVALDAIPLPDVVLVSHDHYDHLDRASVLALARRGARFVTALGVGERLLAWGIEASRIEELDWHEAISPVAGLTLRALPSRHFSGRGVADRNKTLWAAWSIEANGQRLFFGGDGGWDEKNFAAIGEAHGPFDLTMLEIGAFDPAWATVHLGPEKALAASRLLRGRALLPVHWGTFSLGLHAWDTPVEELLQFAAGSDVTLALPRLGESVVAGAVRAVEPWWRVIRETEQELAPAYARAE